MTYPQPPVWDPHTGWTYPPAAEPRRFTINYGFVLLAILSLLVTLFFGLAWLTYDGTETLGVVWLFWGGFWTLIWGAFAIQHTLRRR